ncbi:MAG TPA: hypothetical protein VF695_16040 [Sphingomonas sp.]
MAHDRCRLCTANDQEALIEHVAERLWEKVRRGSLDDRPWETAGGYWQRTYRDLAERAIDALR